MKKYTIQAYSFNELSEEAKQKAIEATRGNESYLDWDWWNCIYDNFKRNMEQSGYEVDNIYFSGFWSQGDGACFTGSVSIDEWLKAHKLGNKYRKLYNLAQDYGSQVIIEQVGNYSHSGTMSFRDYITDYTQELSGEVVSQADEVYMLIKNEAVEKADELYRLLENEYEYQMSDEAIADFLIANEYEFMSDGMRNYYL